MTSYAAKFTVQDDALDKLVATGGALNGAKYKAFTNDRIPNDDDVFGDYVMRDGETVGGTAVAWGTTGTDDQGRAIQFGQTAMLTGNGTEVLPTTLYGFVITNSVGTTLLAVQRFETPVLLDDASDVEPRVIQVSLRK